MGWADPAATPGAEVIVWHPKPASVGLYLYAVEGTQRIRLLRVLKFGRGFVAVDESVPLGFEHGLTAIKRLPGQWAGPITPPETK